MKRKVFYFVILSGLIMASCGGSKGNGDVVTTDDVHNPMTAEGLSAKEVEKMPVLTFDNLVYDFGRVIKGEKLTYAFKFKNTGKSNLIITSARASCGCTTTNPPKAPIRPGETGEIVVSFDSKSQNGEINKRVVVSANTYPVQTTLRIKATVVNP